MTRYVYADDGVHPIGTVEQIDDGRWRASTRHRLLGHFETRDEAVEAVHAALDDGTAP
jgi:hypothetical protein